MGFVVRPLVAGICVLAGVAGLSTSWTPTVFALAANTTALVMGGSFHPLRGPRDSPEFVTDYLDNAVTGHLDPAFGDDVGPVTNAVAVYTPEDFFPLGRLTFDKSVAEGLVNLGRCMAAAPECEFNAEPGVDAAVGTDAPQPDDAMAVFGYSQSAVIASLLKRDLIAQYVPGAPPVSFVLNANPMRPNGGILERLSDWPTIPILGISFPGASPTDSPDGIYQTVDIVRQYDGLGGDFPVRPLNLLATLNALVGYALLHGETVNVPLSEARYQGREGDTRYYLIETDIVPLLQPFKLFVPAPILKALDAPLRVLIEDAYDRDVGPGVPTPASWRPIKDLVGTAAKLVASWPVAVDNLTEGFGFGRVLGTSAPGAFGVGTPDLLAEPDSGTASIAEAVAPEQDPETEGDERAVDPVVVTDQTDDADETDDAAPRDDSRDETGDATSGQVSQEPEPEPEDAADDEGDAQAPATDGPAADEDGPAGADAAEAA